MIKPNTFYKYIFEFIVIVFGISISFFLENVRVDRENENKERLVKLNLLNELSMLLPHLLSCLALLLLDECRLVGCNQGQI